MVYSQRALDRSFGALAHPARRRLLETLSTGPATIGEASSGLKLSKAAITKHVRVLEDAGLVARDIEGRTHRLRVVRPRIESAADWLEDQRRLFTSQLDTIETMLNEDGLR